MTPAGVWAVGFGSGLWLNQHLMKDCGLVPYMLHKVYGYSPAMLGRGSGEYPYLKLMPEMRMELLDVDEGGYFDAWMTYLREHADEMDIVVMFGMYATYSHFIAEYRRLRPDGKIYMALDANIFWTDRMEWTEPWFRDMLDSCDVIATSCRKLRRHLNRKWSRWVVEYIPNGFFNPTGREVAVYKEQKENILLTVGRIGVMEKANHVLLEAFAKCHAELGDWRVQLVGGVEEDFKPYIEEYFKTYPELREKVIFTGIIEDKAELYAQYARAKVFVLTSFVEGGAPNVIAEALFHGCYPVVTNIDAADDITDGGALGKIFPVWDTDALAGIFREICHDNALFNKTFDSIISYAKNNFDWELIVKRLHHLLYERG